MQRLDRELVDRALVPSRTRAHSLIVEGVVSVNGHPATKPSDRVGPTDEIAITSGLQYVSRAAYKLLGALDDLEVSCAGRALDAGASTGGFTQVLLERGCKEVVAVDVGHGQLDGRVRSDPRVVVWERTNLRDLDRGHVDHRPVDLVVADVSFISLTLLVAPLASVLAEDGILLLMVKPQFEVGREQLGKGGVVRSPELHRQAVEQVVTVAEKLGWHAHGLARSGLPGPAGNVEFFVIFRRNRPEHRIAIDPVGAGAYAVPGELGT